MTKLKNLSRDISVIMPFSILTEVLQCQSQGDFENE